MISFSEYISECLNEEDSELHKNLLHSAKRVLDADDRGKRKGLIRGTFSALKHNTLYHLGRKENKVGYKDSINSHTKESRTSEISKQIGNELSDGFSASSNHLKKIYTNATHNGISKSGVLSHLDNHLAGVKRGLNIHSGDTLQNSLYNINKAVVSEYDRVNNNITKSLKNDTPNSEHVRKVAKGLSDANDLGKIHM